MSAGEYCNREVVIVDKSESLEEAIKLMRNHHVGDVIVVDDQEQSRIPVGIVTDRDIIVKLLAKEVSLNAVNITDVMSDELVTVNEQVKLIDAIKLMRQEGVRRVPVVNAQGGLVGILTVDDLVELIAEQLNDIVDLLSKEQTREQHLSS